MEGYSFHLVIDLTVFILCVCVCVIRLRAETSYQPLAGQGGSSSSSSSSSACCTLMCKCMVKIDLVNYVLFYRFLRQ